VGRSVVGIDPDEITDAVFPDLPAREPGEEALGDESAHGDERPIDRFRQTAAGSVVAAGLLGLRDALEGRPEKEEVAIVSEAPGEPVDQGVTLVFDDDDPLQLRVVVRRPRTGRGGEGTGR
jgi:hypothetical protein